MKQFFKFFMTVLMVISVAFAAEAKKKKKKKKPVSEDTEISESRDDSYQPAWGMAGCGLGAIVIDSKSQGGQIGSFFLNITGVQTSGITTGTSNCVDKRGSYSGKEKEVFVAINLNQLEAQAATGQGQHLNALAEIFGCDDKAAFNNLSQDNFAGLYSSRNPLNVISNYEQAIKAQKLNCVRAG